MILRWLRSWWWRLSLARVVAYCYAQRNGYFWLPCPTCGRYFGGHEWRTDTLDTSTIPHADHGGGQGICPTCTEQGVGVRAWKAAGTTLSEQR